MTKVDKAHRPVLKWAGNKHRIVNEILTRLPEGKRLVEPFVGSGAVFCNADYRRYWLCDSNTDLIDLYTILKKQGEHFIDYVRLLFDPQNNNAERYYALREEFNACVEDRVRRAALFLYLNRHGFNGLCRYNAKGGFNVPFGKHTRAYFPETEMRFFLARAQNAVFNTKDFAQCMQACQPGDVIYCDPPYLPLSNTANFTAYHTDNFSLAQQGQLAELARASAARGIPVLISNHDTELARELYVGAEIQHLQVQRNISCKGDGRGKAGELLALFY